METQNGKQIIIETGRGPSISGRRITLYDVMEYLKDDWHPKHIANWLGLTPEEIEGALAYLKEHEAEMEEQYAVVLKNAEEERRYWEERNKERDTWPVGPPAHAGIAIARARLTAIRQEQARQAQAEQTPVEAAPEKCKSS